MVWLFPDLKAIRFHIEMLYNERRWCNRRSESYTPKMKKSQRTCLYLRAFILAKGSISFPFSIDLAVSFSMKRMDTSSNLSWAMLDLKYALFELWKKISQQLLQWQELWRKEKELCRPEEMKSWLDFPTSNQPNLQLLFSLLSLRETR